MEFGTNGVVKVKDFREMIKDLSDDTELIFMIETEDCGFNAQSLVYCPPEFASKEEDEDWDDEECVGEWCPKAMIFISE